MLPLPSKRQHLSCDDCQEVKKEDYQNCCVQNTHWCSSTVRFASYVSKHSSCLDVPPEVESSLYYAMCMRDSGTLVPWYENMTSCIKLYITYRTPSEEDRATAVGNMHKNLGAVRTRSLRVMRVDREMQKQTRPSQYFTTLP